LISSIFPGESIPPFSDLEPPKQHQLFALVFSLKSAFESDPSKLKEIIQSHCEKFLYASAALLYQTERFLSIILGIDPNSLDLSFIPELRAMFLDTKPISDSSQFGFSVDMFLRFIEESHPAYSGESPEQHPLFVLVLSFKSAFESDPSS
jgi:hypothetical protein